MCLFRLHFAFVSCGQVRADTTDRIFQARDGTGFGELNLHRCTRIQSDGVRRPLRAELKAPMRVTTAFALAATSSAIVIFAQLRLVEGSGALQLVVSMRVFAPGLTTLPPHPGATDRCLVETRLFLQLVPRMCVTAVSTTSAPPMKILQSSVRHSCASTANLFAQAGVGTSCGSIANVVPGVAPSRKSPRRSRLERQSYKQSQRES